MEPGSQRYQLAAWLQHMIGPLNLPWDPSEDDLRLVLQDGRVLCNLLSKVKQEKVEESDSLPSSQDRVKLFLSVVSEMKLPVFEVDDLNKVCSSSYDRIVDCLLSIKSYHERNHDNVHLDNLLGVGSCQQALTLGNSLNMKNCSEKDIAKFPSQSRKRWVIPGYENGNVPTLGDDLFNLQQKKGILLQHTEKGPNLLQIHVIKQRICDILSPNTRSAGHSSLAKDLECISTQSLSSFATAIFGNSQHEEVTGLVELSLRKVLEELERCFKSQHQQVAKLKCMLREHLKREHKLAARARLLQTLAAGAGEEVQIVSSQLQQLKVDHKKLEDDKTAKDTMIENYQNEGKRSEIHIENLNQQLEQLQRLDQKHLKLLKNEKVELEKSLRAQILEREALLQESNQKVQELEALIAKEMEDRKGKFDQYACFSQWQLGSLREVKEVLYTIKQEVIFLKIACQENLKALEEELFGMAHAAVGYHKVLAENRLLYNEVQDLKGNIRVFCRVIPFLLGQSAKHSTVEFVRENGDILISNPLKQKGKETRRVFTFNKVFKDSATQEDVFKETQPLVRSVLDGFNVCIFAYGQTGSGKTYTMSGPNSSFEKDTGVNYRAINDLFHISRSRKDVISYEVGVQMIEIYNEQVRDLLFIDASNRRLEIRNSSQLHGVNVPDACMLPVNSTSDVFHLMKIGQRNRVVGATALNDRSSRSHSVLTVHVRGTELASGTVLHGCLHLVDLAGSERVDRSEATGERLKEAQYINRSLSALGDVVSALAQKSSHVPYRNSKLTQLLQDSLGGQAKMLMFVHISPELKSYGETISTLKFAERVASVELGAAKSHKESRELHDLKEQVALLKGVVSKKESEIEHLNVIKGKWCQDKLKSRTASGILVQDSLLDMQEQRIRRQTLDPRLQMQKPLEGQPFENLESALLLASSEAMASTDPGLTVNTSSEADDYSKQTGHEGKLHEA